MILMLEIIYIKLNIKEDKKIEIFYEILKKEVINSYNNVIKILDYYNINKFEELYNNNNFN